MVVNADAAEMLLPYFSAFLLVIDCAVSTRCLCNFVFSNRAEKVPPDQLLLLLFSALVFILGEAVVCLCVCV